jgi:hypothetical protein
MHLLARHDPAPAYLAAPVLARARDHWRLEWLFLRHGYPVLRFTVISDSAVNSSRRSAASHSGVGGIAASSCRRFEAREAIGTTG